MCAMLNTLKTSMQNQIKVVDNFTYNFNRNLARNLNPIDPGQIDGLFQNFFEIQNTYEEVMSGGQGSSGLNGIVNGVNQINNVISDLSQNVQEVKNLYSDILRDAQPGELVQILKVKKVKKIEEGNKETENWFIEVRSDPECVKNFRNVEIWDILNGTIITNFKLIEPKVIIKRKIDPQFLPMTYFVAKIEGKIVSKPYLIPHLKITVKNVNSMACVIIENLFNQNVEDLSLVYNDQEPTQIKCIEGGCSLNFEFNLDEGSKITAYVLMNTQVISNTFNDLPTIDPIIPDISESTGVSFQELNVEQKASHIISKYPNADFCQIMNGIGAYTSYYPEYCDEQNIVQYLLANGLIS